jgi:hypothetical protein
MAEVVEGATADGTRTVASETVYDERIALLEAERVELEERRQRLLNFQLSVRGLDGNRVEVDLGALAGATVGEDPATIERKVMQYLATNPAFRALSHSALRRDELLDELLVTGKLPNIASAGGDGKSRERRLPSPKKGLSGLLGANYRFNRAVGTRSERLARLVGSPWLALAGLLVLLIWAGGPLLFLLTNGAVGGTRQSPGTNLATPSPTFSPNSSPSSTQARTKTQPALSTPTPTLPPPTPGVNANSLRPVENNVVKVGLKMQAEVTASSVSQAQPTPDGERVGKPPDEAGGYNGPHGAFLPPARLRIAALEVEAAVERALTREESGSGKLSLTAPRGDEVVHWGAYPGEAGGMYLWGTQGSLGRLRRLQINDELTLTDRRGNAFVYRVLPFSPTGQPERLIDPTREAWLFTQTGGEEALLTILVNSPLVEANATNTPAVSNRSERESVARDDTTNPQKLAYRAVLALYIPAKERETGVAVAVPESVWRTRPASVITTTPTLTATPVISSTASPSVPATPSVPVTLTIPRGLPATGYGGGANGFKDTTASNNSPNLHNPTSPPVPQR